MQVKLPLRAPLVLAVAALFAATLVPGCDGPSVPGTSSGPSPETIAAEIRPFLSPLMEALNEAPIDNGNFTLMDATVSRSLVEQAVAAREKYSESENGLKALGLVTGELEDIIRRARDEDRWGALLCAIDVHEQWKPGMLLMRRFRDLAQLHAGRPHVVVKGFFDDNDAKELYVFMQVKTRTEEAHVVQVRVKEEFYGLRLVDILGKKRGVILEYLADPGHFFQVLAAPRKPTPVSQALPSRTRT